MKAASKNLSFGKGGSKIAEDASSTKSYLNFLLELDLLRNGNRVICPGWLELLSAGKCVGQDFLVGVFENAAGRHAPGQPCDAD